MIHHRRHASSTTRRHGAGDLDPRWVRDSRYADKAQVRFQVTSVVRYGVDPPLGQRKDAIAVGSEDVGRLPSPAEVGSIIRVDAVDERAERALGRDPVAVFDAMNRRHPPTIGIEADLAAPEAADLHIGAIDAEPTGKGEQRRLSGITNDRPLTLGTGRFLESSVVARGCDHG